MFSPSDFGEGRVGLLIARTAQRAKAHCADMGFGESARSGDPAVIPPSPDGSTVAPLVSPTVTRMMEKPL
jgi:hypothetical protein